MSCQKYEARLALYMEGDLAGRKARRVAAHLETCPACRAFAEDLAASQAGLHSLRAETVDEAELAAVRAGALERIRAGGRRRPWFVWSWAAVAAAAAVLIAALFVRAPQAPIPLPPRIASAPPAPPVVEVVRPRPRVRKRAPPRPAFPTESLVVKLETADPNVVIYWIFDKNGE